MRCQQHSEARPACEEDWRRRLTTGSRYANVLPEPVCDASSTSPPFCTSWNAATCTRHAIRFQTPKHPCAGAVLGGHPTSAAHT